MTAEVTPPSWDDPRVVALAKERCRVINGIPCDGPGNDCDADNCKIIGAIVREFMLDAAWNTRHEGQKE